MIEPLVVGPFLGIEEREALAQPGHARFALNVPLGDALFEHRGGTKVRSRQTESVSDGVPQYSGRVLGFRLYRTAGGAPRFLVISRGTVEAKTEIVVQSVGPLEDFSTVATVGQKFNSGSYLLTRQQNEQTRLVRRYAILDLGTRLVFSNGLGEVYEMDKDGGPPSIQRLATVSPAAFTGSQQYCSNPPAFTVAAAHLNNAVYAGFRETQHLVLTGTVPVNLHDVDPQDVSTTQGYVVAGPQNFYYSDPFVAGDIGRPAYRRLGGEEPITALASFRGELLVFTPRSIWALRGVFEDGDVLSKIYDGVGTVSPESIQETPAGLIWLHATGLHLYDGGAVERVSAPLDPTFHDQPYRELPRDMAQSADGPVGSVFPVWPSRSRLHEAVSLHLGSRGQYWCALPTRQSSDLGNRVVVVFDYERRRWAYYAFGFPVAGLATEIGPRGEERIWMCHDSGRAGGATGPTIVQFHERFLGDEFMNGLVKSKVFMSAAFVSSALGMRDEVRTFSGVEALCSGVKTTDTTVSPSIYLLPEGGEDDRETTSSTDTSKESGTPLRLVPIEYSATKKVHHDVSGLTHDGGFAFQREELFTARASMAVAHGRWARVGLLDGLARARAHNCRILRLSVRAEGDAQDEAP